MRMIIFTSISKEMPGIEILGLRMAFAGEGAMKKTPQELEQAISELRRCISFLECLKADRTDSDEGFTDTQPKRSEEDRFPFWFHLIVRMKCRTYSIRSDAARGLIISRQFV